MTINAEAADAIARIASGGFMALAVLFLVVIFARSRTPAPGAIRAATIVIAIGAVVQVVTYLTWFFVTPRVSVTLTPSAVSFTHFMLASDGIPITTRPLLWLDTSDKHCIRESPEFVANSQGCPAFSSEIFLSSAHTAIHVYVDDVMEELRDRINRLSSAQAASSASRLGNAGSSPHQSPIGENRP